MSISFGACESAAGPAGVAYWDTLFQPAAAEGISVFVSSGDSGAAGCDTAFTAPPSSPRANQPQLHLLLKLRHLRRRHPVRRHSQPVHLLVLHQHLGSSRLSVTFPRAHGTSHATIRVAATGGGVSSFIATPSWQTGAGVPSARAGRYTPDVSFSASGHDGYFACMAALSGSCVTAIALSTSSPSPEPPPPLPAWPASPPCSTRNSAPPRATSIPNSIRSPPPPPPPFTTPPLHQRRRHLLTSTPPACATTASPASAAAARSPAFALTTGYDQATGLGSLDVSSSSTTSPPPPPRPPSPSPALQTIATPGALRYRRRQRWRRHNPTPTGSVTSSSGTYTSAATALVAAAHPLIFPPDRSPPAWTPCTAAYSSDSNYNAATGTNTVTVAEGPTFTISGTAVTVTAGATTGNTSTITVQPNPGFTGSVTLTAIIGTTMSGAQNAPSSSFGATSPVTITSNSAGTATLTISTTVSQTTSCVAVNQTPRGIPWYAQGGAVLACLFLFGIAPRRRSWQTMLGMALLFAALTGGISACGGGKASSCTPVTTPGTTAGTYTIAITGKSGATTVLSTPITLTVQ